jgi:hypothetical protein
MDADKRESTPRHPRRPVAPDHGGAEQGPTQLQLLDDAHLPDWRLDDSTKAIGLHGVAQARAALRTARRRQASLEAPGSADDRRATAA